MVKIAGILQCFNESSRGNLRRCLDNLSAYCDRIVVYDDGSTDDSAAVARTYTEHVIVGGCDDFRAETAHRQAMLDRALALGADAVFWLDADEVLDRNGTEGGLREICELGLPHSFEEVTLWRSLSWRRTDFLGAGWFVRLWPARPDLRIPQASGLHRQLYPDGMGQPVRSSLRVLHYGYATQEAIERRWRERSRLGVPIDVRRAGVDEREMALESVPPEWFPRGLEPQPEPQPEPIRYAADVMDEAEL